MSEPLSARFSRISTEAEALANLLAVERDKHPIDLAWFGWDALYAATDAAMAEVGSALRLLRQHPEMDLEI